MLRPLRAKIKGKEKTLVCVHWKSFPPPTITVEDIEAARKNGQIKEEDYHRHKIWNRECGLLGLDENKCLTCPHVRTLEVHPHQVSVLRTLDGKLATPTVDATTLESMGHHRRK